MDKNVDMKKISRQIFPNHTELGAYNQLAGKIGRRPLNQKEYDELKRTGRRPDSEINSENKTRNMAKNIIRLTESDLHKIVKESVQRILNEVEIGGESLHGNNPEDWATVSHLRDANVVRDEDLSDYNRYYQGLANPRYSALNNRRQGVKDAMNMRDTVKGSEDPDAFGKAYDAGREKAKSIINNRNREKMNKQFGGW